MATYTTNYSLVKPDQTDFYNVDDFNDNADIIDTALKGITDTLEGFTVDEDLETLYIPGAAASSGDES